MIFPIYIPFPLVEDLVCVWVRSLAILKAMLKWSKTLSGEEEKKNRYR